MTLAEGTHKKALVQDLNLKMDSLACKGVKVLVQPWRLSLSLDEVQHLWGIVCSLPALVPPVLVRPKFLTVEVSHFTAVLTDAAGLASHLSICASGAAKAKHCFGHGGRLALSL